MKQITISENLYKFCEQNCQPGKFYFMDIISMANSFRIYYNSQYCIEIHKIFDEETGEYFYNFDSNIFYGFDDISLIDFIKVIERKLNIIM